MLGFWKLGAKIIQKRQGPQQLDRNEGSEKNKKKLTILKVILKSNNIIFKAFYKNIILCTSQI